MQRGQSDPPTEPPRLFEILDLYLEDPAAQHAFAEAERLARRPDLSHRYLYLPSTAGPDTLAHFWHGLKPKEIVMVAGEEEILSDIPGVQARRSVEDSVAILHCTTHE